MIEKILHIKIPNKGEIEDMNELTVGQALILPLNSNHNSTPITHRIE